MGSTFYIIILVCESRSDNTSNVLGTHQDFYLMDTMEDIRCLIERAEKDALERFKKKSSHRLIAVTQVVLPLESQIV